MATPGERSSLWDHTLQTTRSRLCSQQLSPVGVQSKSLLSIRQFCANRSLNLCRCLAHPKELDDIGEPRFREQDEVMLEEFDPGILWHGFGIVADAVVRLPSVILSSPELILDS